MKLYNLLFFLVLVNLKSSNCAKILAVFTVPSRSHSILGYELFKELVKSGHEVTVISPQGNELKNPPENYTNIIIGGAVKEAYDEQMAEMFDNVETNPVRVFYKMVNTTSYLTKHTILDDQVQSLLKSNIKFDLVISEVAMNEALFGFSEHFKCPHISLSTVGATSWIEDYTSNPSPYSYIPNVFLDLTDRMTFFERLQNTLFNVIEGLMIRFMQYDKQREIYETAFPSSKDFRPFWEKIRHGVSLVLLNSHYTLGFPRPFFPNLVEVCGMHIKKKTNPLPDDIKKFIDDSESVVYFSLGSNLNPSVMAKEKQQAVVEALSNVKGRRILWKWDDESIDVDKGKFLIRKWFPQDDILAHPKVKLFITHGGLLSGSESVYYGKPLLVIPIFGDQKLNAARTVSEGFGVRVDYKNLTKGSLTWAINEMLDNPKYTARVQELSKRFKDRPQHPVDLAKFFVEYVIRHKGAPFMQSSSTYLDFIQLYNIDVILTIMLFLFIAVIIPFAIIKKLFKVLLSNKQTNSRKIKKN